MEEKWKTLAAERPSMSGNSIKQELDLEAQWITDTLTQIFDLFYKPLRVCARLKCWWNESGIQARTKFKACRREHQRQIISSSQYKAQRNAFYWEICKAKGKCSENSIQGDVDIPEGRSKDLNPDIKQQHVRYNENKQRCWEALRYTKS